MRRHVGITSWFPLAAGCAGFFGDVLYCTGLLGLCLARFLSGSLQFLKVTDLPLCSLL